MDSLGGGITANRTVGSVRIFDTQDIRGPPIFLEILGKGNASLASDVEQRGIIIANHQYV